MADGRNFERLIRGIPGGIWEGLREVFRGALDDIRHRWEEAWFGKKVTPDREDRLGEGLEWMKDTAQDMKTSWDAMCAELARQRGHQPEQSHQRESDHDLDR